MPAKAKQTPGITLIILLSTTKKHTIVAAKHAKNKMQEESLSGFFKSLHNAAGLLIHKGQNRTRRLPAIKKATENAIKVTIPKPKVSTPASSTVWKPST